LESEDKLRKEFEMTQKELDEILDACKPVPCMLIGGHEPPSAQENANQAWQRLAKKKGFIWDTVKPCSKGNRFFTAEVREAKA
jgi:hypothetical protein